jgi:DNA invertase Pin-like site-specific DNA recombinase
MSLVFGYARVSTDGQTLEAQLAQLEAAGADKGVLGEFGRTGGGVYREKVSGAALARPQLARLLEALSPGDVVLVTRLDRLARSTRDLLNVLGTVAEKGAAFRSLGDPWADTTTPHGRLMLTVLGGLAEFERELIRARTGEGRARAKALGVKMGRPHKLTAHQQREARARREAGETLVSIARSYNVHHATIGRL